MISKEEVLKIAKLARLELTENEVEKMQKDLSSVLDYFEILKKVKSDPNFRMHPNDPNKKNATRKDEVIERPANLAKNLIAGAPDKKDDYLKVKSIL